MTVHEPTASAVDRPRVRWVGPTAGAGVEAVFGSLAVAAEVGVTGFESGEPCDLVVFACPTPLADPSAIESFAAGADCPVVQLLGVWCEGEGRTGRPPSGVPRVFWHAWPEWWNAWRSGAIAQASNSATLVQVVTPRRDDAEAIGDVLRDAGFATAWSCDECDAARIRGAAAAIWCGTQLDGLEADRLAAICAAVRPAPMVALLDFPRPETVAAAQAIGAARVLGKPCDADALVACVRSLVAAERRRGIAVRVAKELGVESSAPRSEAPLPAAA